MVCHKSFVTLESTCELGTPMPRATWSSSRVIDKKPKPEQRFITNDAVHLTKIWQ